MAGVRLHAIAGGERGGIGDAPQFRRSGLAFDISKTPGVKFDDRHAKAHGRFDLLRRWLDEQADADSGLAEAIDDRAQGFELRRRVEPALGGPFLALFRDDAGGVGAVGERDRQHFGGRRHFQVQGQGDLGHQAINVGIGDMPPIFAQVGGDPVGPGGGGGVGCAHRIGMRSAARVADRRDMVDVDPEAQVWLTRV